MESRSRPPRNGSERTLFCRLAWRISSVGKGLNYGRSRRDGVVSLMRRRGPATCEGSRFSGSLGLELVELEPCAGDHARKIGRQHHHIEAALHSARCERRAGTMHDGLDAVLMRGLPDLVAGREMDRVWIVAARYEPQRER